jgi:hypothetical protein
VEIRSQRFLRHGGFHNSPSRFPLPSRLTFWRLCSGIPSPLRCPPLSGGFRDPRASFWSQTAFLALCRFLRRRRRLLSGCSRPLRCPTSSRSFGDACAPFGADTTSPRFRGSRVRRRLRLCGGARTFDLAQSGDGAINGVPLSLELLNDIPCFVQWSSSTVE